MSITDELREYAGSFYLFRYKDVREKLDAIADRIDTEYQKAIRELNNLADTSVLLPVDADGQVIRIGDVMVYKDNTIPMKVIALIPPSTFLTENGPRYADMCRHYKPTVEDLLSEFASRVCNSGHQWGLDAADTIAEYAAKLRLADDGKE